MEHSLLAVVAVLALATLIRSVLGFGEALIAVPLLAFVMPVKTAVPLAVLVSITVAAIILLLDWRRVQLRSAALLLISTIFGIPAGLLLLSFVPDAAVKTILAFAILAFAGYSLLSRHRHSLDDDRTAWLFGFHAGFLGGAYGMNGPPLAVYGSLRGWHPEQFRATLQAYFLPASVAGMLGYWITGLWTPVVSDLYVAALPGVILATLGGREIGRRIAPHRFTTVVYSGLLVIGLLLLHQAVMAGLFQGNLRGG